MADIITTLHPENDANTNLYPNIKNENIPNGSIDMSKLSDDVKTLFNPSPEIHVDTSTNILAFTENKGIYVGSDTGYWYYWNGTQYVSGGVYQASQIAENSVTIIDTKFYAKNSLNLLIKEDITRGYYIYTNGNISALSSYFYTDYIECIPYIIYFIRSQNNNTFIVFYDENKQYLSGTYTSGTTFTTNDSQVKYMRLSMPLEYLDECFVSRFNTITSAYVISNNNLENDSLKLEIAKGTFNLFDASKIATGYYMYYQTGRVSSLSNYYYSDFIPVTPNTKVYFKRSTGQLHISWFNSNYAYISGALIGDNDADDYFTSPSTASYVVISSATAYKDSVMVSYYNMQYKPYYTLKYLDKYTMREKVVIASDGDFNDIFDGFEYAFKNKNCDVYINESFDLTTILSNMVLFRGLRIGGNNKYIFSSKAIISFNYTGTDADILTYMAMFISRRGYGDFELYNLKAECSNIEYVVHDENGGIDTNEFIPYIHKYINCNMTITRDIQTYPQVHCIGAGNGEAGYVVIDGCVFNGVDSLYGDVGFHGNWINNSYSSQGKFNLIVTNSYFEHTLYLHDPDPENTPKQVLFTNNSISENLMNTSASGKWDIKEWNNILRN